MRFRSASLLLLAAAAFLPFLGRRDIVISHKAKQYPDAHLFGTRRTVSDLVDLGDDKTHFTSDNQSVIEQCDYLIVALIVKS